jgi:hypothetical protein
MSEPTHETTRREIESFPTKTAVGLVEPGFGRLDDSKGSEADVDRTVAGG